MQTQKFSFPNPTLTPPRRPHLPQKSGVSTRGLIKRVSMVKPGGLTMVRASSSSSSPLEAAGNKVDDDDDGFYIRRAVELARRAIGCTSPNPMVGCVIVKDGQVVGEGFHPEAGQPHAEVFALRDAGDLAANATAYVSLEPCNHYGRTPPCSEALVKAKVKKVVVGMVDPNPIVASKGLDRLRSVGIEVVTGVEEELCKRLNEAYIHRMITGKPFVTLRYSLSANRHVLNILGEHSAEHGGYYSKLLQEYDAVILSSSLVENSSLPASQEPGANQPLSVIIGKSPCRPIHIPNLTEEAVSKVVIFTDEEANVQPGIVQKGVETVVLEQMNLDAILEYCHRRGLCSVLLDLRGDLSDFEELLQDGIEKNLLQKVMLELLPFSDEGSDGNTLAALKDIEEQVGQKIMETKSSTISSSVLEVYL